MKRVGIAAVAVLLWAGCVSAAEGERRLSVKEYRDRAKAGWVGQIVGVAFGAPTEFRSRGRIIPERDTPAMKPELVNHAFNQDDLYVEMTFVRLAEERGLDFTQREAGVAFANSRYALWHANAAGRHNLLSGVAPPDSGHPKFNAHADDIDYQIEADWSGLIAPGMRQLAIDLGDRVGHVMNYGDGVYGGQFVGGMYAEAFFERDVGKVVEAGLACIPPESQYAQCIRDVIAWHREAPSDWEAAWRKVEDKYHKDPAFTHGLCSRPGGEGEMSIDAKLNGAYIALGLLYGQGDPLKTMAIATRCGQDSDCNPSSAAGVLFTCIGFAALPEPYRLEPDPKSKFRFTAYDFPGLLSASEKLAREAVVRAGGRVEKDAAGDEYFVIPTRAPVPSKLERSREPGPAAGSRFTAAERQSIDLLAHVARTRQPNVDLAAAAGQFAPGWKLVDCDPEMNAGPRGELGGRRNIFVTQPLQLTRAAAFQRQVAVPPGKKTTLRLVVGRHPDGEWVLVVRADGKQNLLRKRIDAATAPDGWLQTEVDLSRFAGKDVLLSVENQPASTFCEAYWAEIAIRSE